jgi:hypothetical protein
MKKLIVKLDNDVIENLTAEEITELEQAQADAETSKQARINAETAKENLKTSAKAKLMAGEPLTEDEANTIVL